MKSCVHCVRIKYTHSEKGIFYLCKLGVVMRENECKKNAVEMKIHTVSRSLLRSLLAVLSS